MDTLLIVVHIIVAIALIGLVLLQQGKGADMGAAFGSGASSTVFGSRGSANFLTRTTGMLATVFFITSLVLAYFSGKESVSESVVDRVDMVAPVEQTAPAAEVPQAPAAEDVPLVPSETPAGDVPSQ